MVDGKQEPIHVDYCCIFDNFVEDVIIDRAVELAMAGYKENSLQGNMMMNTRKQ